MRIAVLIARILLGLEFVVFGLNKFHSFMPMQMPDGLAGQLMGAMFASHYLLVVGAFEVAGGALVLAGQFIPLGLVLLGPVIVNILVFDILLAPKALPIGLVTALLWFIVFFGVRHAFTGIFVQKVEVG